MAGGLNLGGNKPNDSEAEKAKLAAEKPADVSAAEFTGGDKPLNQEDVNVRPEDVKQEGVVTPINIDSPTPGLDSIPLIGTTPQPEAILKVAGDGQTNEEAFANTIRHEEEDFPTGLNINLQGKDDSARALLGEGVIANYSSHPIMRYAIGDFQFNNGLLSLSKQDRVDEFEKVLSELPLSESIKVRKLDVAGAEEIAREFMARNPVVTRGMDSATGDRAPQNMRGTGVLGED